MIVLFLGGIFSCQKKDYPKPLVVENPAVYYSKLTIDNKQVLLQAGVDDYYMYSSYKLDSSSLLNYVADLKKRECSNCTNSLKIQINDYKVSFIDPPKIDSSLRVAKYPYLAGNPLSSYAVQFISQPDNTASYFWDFGDGTTDTQQNPKHHFDKAGEYSICLTTTANNGYVNTICNKIKIDAPPTKALRADVSANSLSGNIINFNGSGNGGVPPYKYLWTLADGWISQQSAFSHTYTYRGSSAVVLRVIDSVNDTIYMNYNAKTFTDNSSHPANYSVSTIQKNSPLPAFSKITITWIDSDGVVYTSNDVSQPNDSFFEILSVTENEKNENGESTKKINARFKCKLYNGSKSITVNDAEVVICVAYKN